MKSTTEQMNDWMTMETQICPGFILAINLQKRSIGIIKLKKDHLHGKSLSVTFHSSHEDRSSLAELSMQMSQRSRVNMERLHFYIWEEAPGRLASVLSGLEPESYCSSTYWDFVYFSIWRDRATV